MTGIQNWMSRRIRFMFSGMVRSQNPLAVRGTALIFEAMKTPHLHRFFVAITAAVALQACAAASAEKREDPRVRPALKFNPNVTEQPAGASYDVFGTTPEDIHASLTANLPKYDGRRVLGSHSYWISYSYTTRAKSLRCTADVKFTVQSTTTLPKWKDRDKADSSVRAQWDVFMAALTRHEDGHRAIAIKKVDLMQRRMTALEPMTCAELRPQIKEIFDRMMEEMRTEQSAWDANPANRSAPFIPGARRPTPPILRSTPPADLAGTEWRLLDLASMPELSSDFASRQTIRFPADTMRVSGNLGCNRASGPYAAADNGLLSFAPLASTRRACGNPAQDEQESRFAGALAGTTSYHVASDTLSLIRQGAVLARLLKLPR